MIPRKLVMEESYATLGAAARTDLQPGEILDAIRVGLASEEISPPPLINLKD